MWNLTVNNLSSRPLKGSLILVLIILLIPGEIYTQSLIKLKSINLTSSVEQVSIDRQGYFYCATSNGDINKYNRDGSLLYQFSPSKNGPPTLIEAWQGLKVFSYYQSFQEYLFLDRFMNGSERFDLQSGFSSFSSLGTMSGDDNLWLIDEQNLSLKKIDLSTDQIISDTPLNLNLPPARYAFSHIREYQNQLFISDPKHGLLIFDRFGNFSEQEDLPKITYFNFIKDELYYLDGAKLKFIKLYTKQKREIDLLDPSYRFVLMENSILICFAENRIDFYKLI